MEPDGDNIWVASGDGDILRVRTLVELGISPNAQDEFGYTPMHAAASYGHIELLQYLLDQAGDIEIRDADGDTPLLYCEEPSVFTFLVSKGANVNARNTSGQTIVEKAIQDENVELMKFLHSAGFADDSILAHIEKCESGEVTWTMEDILRFQAAAEQGGMSVEEEMDSVNDE